VKLPKRIERITPDWSASGRSTYPPLGFVPFAENALGNGDCFGLYWPFGKEHQEPLVLETQHDGWALSPTFSSLERFLTAADGSDEWVEPPTLQVDADSPYACLKAAEALLSRNELEGGVAQLLVATTELPEFGAAEWLLSRHLSRLGRASESFAAALSAVIAPPCLGGGSAEALAWLQRQTQCPPEFANDPLWRRRSELRFKFGGTKENQDYLVVRALVTEYQDAGLGVQAMLLLQTYGELMSRETVSFQARYDFSEAHHINAQLRLGMEVGIDRRVRAEAAL
jgi:hypothetical protein